MNGMICKCVTIALLCMFLPLAALAQGLEEVAPLEGQEAYQILQGDPQAVYRFSYQYPQFVAHTQQDEAINVYYQTHAENMRSVIIPQSAQEAASLWGEDSPPLYTDVRFQITLNDRSYLSVFITTHQFLGYSESESIMANVFARDGIYAGEMVSLSQVMGLESAQGETLGVAGRLVYPLVWQIIQQEAAGMQRDYFEDLSPQDLMAAFSPETDFYLDAEGNLVFFIQAGAIASEVEGVLLYPFSLGELLSTAQVF